MAEFTKGSWKIIRRKVRNKNTTHRKIVGGKSGYYEIAKLRTIHYWEELPNLVYPKDAIEQDAEMEANAALISAAPDLYAAL
ncbi:MAG: hypothetical protein ACXADB_11595, partial [Candidatus Hermodarchaeia archaeon]